VALDGQRDGVVGVGELLVEQPEQLGEDERRVRLAGYGAGAPVSRLPAAARPTPGA
jgi:hypothetical protein